MRASILLLCMNHERYIQQCLESIFHQTFTDFEIIFLDNASTDASFEIGSNLLENSGVKYKAFKRERSHPVSENINFLLDNSEGVYIFPFSTDDWMAPTNIEEKLQLVSKPGIGWVFGGGWWYYEDTGEMVEVDTAPFKRENMAYNLLLDPPSYFWVGSAYPRNVLMEMGKWDERLIVEDLDMNLRIAMKYKIDFVPLPLVYYRRHSSTLMSNYRLMHKGFRQYYQKHKHNRSLPMKRWLSNACKNFTYESMDAGKVSDTLYFAFKTQFLSNTNKTLPQLWPLLKGALLKKKMVQRLWAYARRS